MSAPEFDYDDDIENHLDPNDKPRRDTYIDNAPGHQREDMRTVRRYRETRITVPEMAGESQAPKPVFPDHLTAQWRFDHGLEERLPARVFETPVDQRVTVGRLTPENSTGEREPVTVPHCHELSDEVISAAVEN